MWIVYVIMFLLVIVVSLLWVSGITSTHKKYPDYKGDFRGFDFEDSSEWDVTLMDGLEEEEVW